MFVIEIVVGAISSLLAMSAFSIFQRVFRPGVRAQSKKDATYAERLAELTTSLATATEEVDTILAELARVAQERASSVQKLETELANLEVQEKDLKAKVDALKQTPIPAVEHLATLLKPGEQRSARRDYVLFGAGVLLSTVISIGLQWLPTFRAHAQGQSEVPTAHRTAEVAPPQPSVTSTTAAVEDAGSDGGTAFHAAEPAAVPTSPTAAMPGSSGPPGTKHQ